LPKIFLFRQQSRTKWKAIRLRLGWEDVIKKDLKEMGTSWEGVKREDLNRLGWTRSMLRWPHVRYRAKITNLSLDMFSEKWTQPIVVPLQL